MRADQFNGLMWQYLVVLGVEDTTDDSVLSPATKGRVAKRQSLVRPLFSIHERHRYGTTSIRLNGKVSATTQRGEALLANSIQS